MRFFSRHRRPRTTVTRPAVVVDAIAVSPDGVVGLLLGFERTMSIDDLAQRVHDYVGFALDGQMVRDFPQTAGRRVRIVLALTEAPWPELLEYIDQIRPRLAGYGVDFEETHP
jgi:hypothetical protein